MDGMGVSPPGVLVPNLPKQKLLVRERRARSGGFDDLRQVGVGQPPGRKLIVGGGGFGLWLVGHGWLPCSVFVHDNILYHARQGE